MRRAPLRFQCLSLLHAEAVLLIGDNETQMGKDDIFLEQGVRADQYIDVPCCQLLQDLMPLRCLRISGEISDADGKAFVEMLECLIVLPCQDLSRCHECT